MPERRIYAPEDLAGFERARGIQLPRAYKDYLCQVGAGEVRYPSPLGSEDSARAWICGPEEWCQPYSEEDLPHDFLARPFPHQEAWNDLPVKDPAAGWNAAYYDPLLFRGAMRITNTGCEGYHVLVVSGPERGNVWCDERVSLSRGIYPLRLGHAERTPIDAYLAWQR